MVDPTFLEVDAAHPTPSLEQSCTPQPHPLPSTSATLSTSSTSTYASHPSLTQVLIYKIGNLARSANAKGEVPLIEMPEIVPHFELRVDAPTSIAEQPTNVEDDVSDDDVVEETNEEKFMRDNENVIIETQ
uniref:Uncharacterized protein n=1 Tax=Solanum tuberosum TaxID=4113 RepID=M1DHL9_SOLTU